MNNILIYSDLHISQSSLKECIIILEEIGMLVNKYDCDTIINLGDTFDGLKPSSQEMDVFATFIRRLGNKQHIILAADSHESTTQTESIINHYGILSDNVTIAKEFKDGTHLYCGHFSIRESANNYGAKISKEIFKDYLYVFLGHIHSYELIKPNILHLGSCRYVNFDESKDKQKIIALLTDYGTEAEKVHFIKLKSPIPMIQLELCKNTSKNSPKEAISDPILATNGDVGKDTPKVKSSISQAQTSLNPGQFETICQLSAFLDKTDPRTKVKVVIKDFESFREFLPLVNKYNAKFEVFKYETDFEVISVNKQYCKTSEMTSFKASFANWLNQKEIDTKIKEILQKELE